MTVPVGRGLYGECREAERCICGLCADIAFGHQSQGRPPLKPKPLPSEPAEIEAAIEKAAKKLKAKLPKKEPKPRLLMGEPALPDPCGCLIWRKRRIKWCYAPHTPQSHPNPCQHERTIVQNFGKPTQKSVCLSCSNDISE